MKALIPKSAELRAEVKEVLKKRGIENSKITIVRRHYCFERKDIPQGPLFVLKVKTPATHAAFPSDLKGKHFIAAMGTQGAGWVGDAFTDDEIDATRNWLKQKSLTIAGGTKEVQMNIIAKRVLGLPDACANNHPRHTISWETWPR